MKLKSPRLVKLTILLTSMMTVMAGATIAPSLPEMVKAFPDNSNAEALVKLVLTIPGLFIAITAPFSGWIIDRFGRIQLLVIMLLLYAIAGTSGLYLNSLTEILIGRALLGIAVGGIMTTAVALIGDYYEGEERQKFLGTQAGIMALAGTLFITGGGLLADISWRYPFLIYGTAAAVIPLVLLFLKEPDREPITQKSNGGLKNIPVVVWIVYGLSFLGMATFYMTPIHLPFFLQEVMKVGNTEVGIALATVMLLAGTVSLNYPKFKSRLTYFQIYSICFLLMGLGFMAISQAESYLTVFPGLIIAGAGAGLVMPNSNLCLVMLATPDMRGRILGLLTTFVFLGQFASPLLTEPIVAASSIIDGFFYIGIVLTVFSIIFLIRNKRLVQ